MTSGRRFKLPMFAWCLLAIAVVPFGWYHLSVQPGAALMRWLFELEPMVVGSDAVPLERPGVSETSGITIEAPGWPDAQLNVYTPDATGSMPVLLWLHGGGFVANSAADVAGFARVVADNDFVVAALDYSLAPGSNYPTPLAQANAALAWLRDNAEQYGGDPSRFFIGGDSAGAQMTSQLAAMHGNEAYAAGFGFEPALPPGVLRGAIMYCGFYDVVTASESGFPALRTFFWAYTGTRNWQAFDRLDELSSVNHVTENFPAAFLAVGDADPFEGQAVQLAQALEQLGVDVTTQLFEDSGLGHEFQFNFELPEAVTTLHNTITFMQEQSR